MTDPLISVRDLKVHFKKAAARRSGSRWRQPGYPAWRDFGTGGRIRLREVDAWAGHPRLTELTGGSVLFRGQNLDN